MWGWVLRFQRERDGALSLSPTPSEQPEKSGFHGNLTLELGPPHSRGDKSLRGYGMPLGTPTFPCLPRPNPEPHGTSLVGLIFTFRLGGLAPRCLLSLWTLASTSIFLSTLFPSRRGLLSSQNPAQLSLLKRPLQSEPSTPDQILPCLSDLVGINTLVPQFPNSGQRGVSRNPTG